MNNKEKSLKYDFRDNSFSFIRWIAALSVMFGHYFMYADKAFLNSAQYSIFTWDKNIPMIFNTFSGLIRGVPIFFAMSAFLISASIERSKSPKEYFVKRFKRIYPELWLAVAVNAVIVFILLGKPILKDLILWIVVQSTGMAFTPGAFDSFATGSLNGAMWTIFVMIQSYVILYIFYRFLKKMNMFGWIALITLCAVFNVILSFTDGFIYDLLGRTIIPYALWFVIGAFLYNYKDKAIPILKEYFWVYTLIFLGYYIVNRIHNLHIPGYYCPVIDGLFLPVITVGFAYKFKNIKVKLDLTYEIYLYHWIALNLLVYFNAFEKINWIVCIMIYIVSTLVVSYISNIISKKIVR